MNDLIDFLNPQLDFNAREQLVQLRQSVEKMQATQTNFTCNPLNVHRLNNHIDEHLGRENRLALYSWLCQREIKTTTDLTDKEAAALLSFAQPEKTGKKKYEYAHGFIVLIAGLKELGVES